MKEYIEREAAIEAAHAPSAMLHSLRCGISTDGRIFAGIAVLI